MASPGRWLLAVTAVLLFAGAISAQTPGHCDEELLSTLKKQQEQLLARYDNRSDDLEAMLKMTKKDHAALLEVTIARTIQLDNVEAKLNMIKEQLDKLLARNVTQTTTELPTFGPTRAPPTSCKELKETLGDEANVDDFYWIKPRNYDGESYKVLCDMTTLGGGWTLFATKVSPEFVWPSEEFNPASGSNKRADSKGCIHPGTNWSEVLFRFEAFYQSSVHVVYSRNGGAASQAKTHFNQFLECSSIHEKGRVDGFTQYTPHINGGKRSPAVGYHSYENFYFHTSHGVTFNCNANRQDYVDLWYRRCGGEYRSVDDVRARSTKCIGGYCFVDRAVWVLYR